jgi:hypothetical protein
MFVDSDISPIRVPAAIAAGSGGGDRGIHLERIPVTPPESRAACIKRAELENARLRKLVVELLLQNALLEEKLVKPRSDGR